MNQFTVDEKDSGQRLDKYIARLIPSAPKSFIYKALRNKDIRLNEKKAAGCELLSSGDRILFRFPDVQFIGLGGTPCPESATGDGVVCRKSANGDGVVCRKSANGDGVVCRKSTTGDGVVCRKSSTGDGSGCDKRETPPFSQCDDSAFGKESFPKQFGTILYEDADIILEDKPAGVLSQKAKPEDFSINDALLKYCGGKTATFTPSVCNRLDRNTSGLIIFAKTYRGAREMTACLKDRSASKFYLAAVRGSVAQSGHMAAKLLKEEKTNVVRILPADAAEGDLIETAYEPVASRKIKEQEITLLKVELLTGKTHQIRAHLASIGYPILGDPKYGRKGDGEELHIRRMMLHSYELQLPERGTFKTAVPEAFLKLFPQQEY